MKEQEKGQFYFKKMMKGKRRQFISWFLIFQLLMSSLYVRGNEIQLSTGETEFIFTEENIQMERSGTKTHPTVILRVETGGQGIAGVTYERGYGAVATEESPRLYGVEAGVPYEIKDVYRYVSVYVQLADGTSARKYFELTGERVYNSGSASFSIYPERAFTDEIPRETYRYRVGKMDGASDNGPIVAVDDEVWVFASNLEKGYIFNSHDLTKELLVDETGPKSDLPYEIIDISSTIGNGVFHEYSTSIIYDGRYVMSIDTDQDLVIVEKKGKEKKLISTTLSNVEAIIKNYTTILSGNVGGITYTHDALYFLKEKSNDTYELYKAPRQIDGTYIVGLTPLTTVRSMTSGSVMPDMIYDGSNIWISNNDGNLIYKYNVGLEQLEEIKTPSATSRQVFDGKYYIYATPIQGENIYNTSIYRINIYNNAVDAPKVFDSVKNKYKEDLTFDGRNMWVWSYGYGTNYYYDLETQQVNEVDYWAGSSKNDTTTGVYDGQYLWTFQFYTDEVAGLSTSKSLTYNEAGVGLAKYFSYEPTLDPSTIVAVDYDEETKPNYVDIKTVAGKTTSKPVQVLWSFDQNLDDANTRDAAFFRDMNNYSDDTAYRESDANGYVGNTYGKYFEIYKSSPYYPSMKSEGQFDFSMPTFPKQNGYYTLYMRGEDGKENIETIEINNYRSYVPVKINVIEVDQNGDVLLKDNGEKNSVFSEYEYHQEYEDAKINIKKYEGEIQNLGYTIHGSYEKTITANENAIVEFYVQKNTKKWGRVHIKSSYDKNGVSIDLPEQILDNLYLEGTEQKINAPYFDGYRLLNPEMSSKSILIQGGTETEYGINNLEFKYKPNDQAVLVKGVGVTENGIPTGETVYSQYVEGDENTVKTLVAEDSTEEWERYGLVEYNSDGTLKVIHKEIYSKDVTFGKDSEVVFAYVRKQTAITVEYIRAEDSVVIETDVYMPNVGTSVILKAKDLPGYRLAEGELESISIKANAATTYQFKYVRNSVQIGVKGIEVSGTPYHPTGNTVYSEQSLDGEGVKKQINGRTDLENWELVGVVQHNELREVLGIDTSKTAVDVEYGVDTEAVFAYTRRMSTVTVKYVEQGTGVEVKEADTFEVPLNTKFTGIGKAIDGFKLATPEAYRTTIMANDTTEQIEFMYIPIMENVTIEARLDTDTGEVLGYDAIDLPLGSVDQKVYATNLQNMLSPRYQLESVSPYLLDKVEKTSKVTFVFKEKRSHVTIQYVDEKNNAIAEAQEFYVPYGETIRASAISVKDYYLKDSNDGTFEKTANNESDGKTFVYKRSNGSISVIAKDQDTGEILSYDVRTGPQGDALSVQADQTFDTKDFYDYYVLQGDNNQSLNFTNTHQEMIFNFKKITYNVTIRAIDENGDSLEFFDGTGAKTFTYNKGDSYILFAPPVKDYEIIEGGTHYISKDHIVEDVEYTFKYSKIMREVDIIIYAMSDEGGIIGVDTITGHRGVEVTININDYPELYGSDKWELISGAEVTAVYGQDSSVSFVCRRKKVNVEIHHIHSETREILERETRVVPTQSDIIVVSKAFDEYQLSAEESLSKKVSIGEVDRVTTESAITVEYDKVQGNIFVQAVDLENNVLGVQWYSQDSGTTFTANPEDFLDGSALKYEYVSAYPEASFTVSSNSEENKITLYFKKKMANVTVSYVDSKGNPIKTTDTFKKQYGEEIDIYAPNIDSYNIVGEMHKVFTVDEEHVNAGEVSVVFTYKKMDYTIITDGVINVIAQTDGGKVLGKVSFTGEIGQSQTFSASTIFGDIEGYILDGTGEELAVFPNGYVDVIFVYKVDNTHVKVVAKDSKGNVLDFEEPSMITVQKGSTIVVEAPHVQNYVLQEGQQHQYTYENIQTEKIANFIYVHMSDVADEYMATVTIRGEDVADSHTLYSYNIKVPFNTEYTINAPVIRTYKVLGNQEFSIKIGAYGTENYVLTIPYQTTIAGANAYYISNGKNIDGVPSKPIENAIINGSVTEVARHIDGYKYLGYSVGAASGDLIESTIGVLQNVDEHPEKNGIFFHYEKYVDENVVIYAVEGEQNKDNIDLENDRIIMSTAEFVSENELNLKKINAPNLQGDAYTLISDSEKLIVELKPGEYGVVFVYKKKTGNIAINTYESQISESTKLNTYSDMQNYRVGESIVVSAPEEGGYTLASEEGMKKIIVSETEEDNSVDFIYTKLPQNSIEVVMKNVSNNEIINRYSVQGTKGERVVIVPMEIIGWTLADNQLNKNEILIGDEAIEHIFFYNEDVETLIVEHYDDDGNQIQSDKTYKVPKTKESLGYTLNHTVYAPHIQNYLLVDVEKDNYIFNDINKGKAHRFIYQKVDKVAVDYMAKVNLRGVDTEGVGLYTMDVYVPKGRDYVAEAVQLPTYEVQGDATIVMPISMKENADETITFTYKTLYRNVESHYVDAATNTAITGITKKVVNSAIVHQPYTDTAINVNGFYYVGYSIDDVAGPLNKSTVIAQINDVADAGNKIYFHYKKVTSDNVRVIGVEGDVNLPEENLPIIRMEGNRLEAKEGATVEVTAPEGVEEAGYDLLEESTRKTVTYQAGTDSYNVYFHFEKSLANITVKTYVQNEDGTKEYINTHENYLIDQRVLETAQVTPPNEPGYFTEEGTRHVLIQEAVDSEANVVEFEYQHLPQNAFNVYFVGVNEEGTEEVLTKHIVKGTIGDEIYITPISIPGWKAVNTNLLEVAIKDVMDDVKLYYKKDMAQLKINLVDLDGETLPMDAGIQTSYETANTNEEIGYKLNYTVYAPHIEGWILADEKQFVTFTDENKDEVETFTYQRIDNVAEQYMRKVYVEGKAGEDSLYRYELLVQADKVYTIEPLNMPTYRLKVGEEVSKDVLVPMNEKSRTITFEYETTIATINVVTMVESDENEGTYTHMNTEVKKDAVIGQPYAVNAPVQQEGYYYVGYNVTGVGSDFSTNTTGKIDVVLEGVEQSIYFYYKKIKDPVLIVYKEKNDVDVNYNERIIGSETKSPFGLGEELKEIEMPNGHRLLSEEYYKKIDGYSYKVTVEKPVDIAYTTVEFYLEKQLRDVNVVVRDEDTGAIVYEEEIKNARVGELLEVSSPNVTDYINSGEVKMVEIQLGDGPQEIGFTAKKIEKKVVQVRYINSVDNTLIDTYQIAAVEGQVVTVNAKDLVGWKFLGDTKAVDVVAKAEATVDFYFEPNMTTLTVNYIMKKTIEGVEEDVEIGESVSIKTPSTNRDIGYELKEVVYAKPFEGYMLKEGEAGVFTFTDEVKEHTFIYEPVENILSDFTLTVHVSGMGKNDDGTVEEFYNFTSTFPVRSGEKTIQVPVVDGIYRYDESPVEIGKNLRTETSIITEDNIADSNEFNIFVDEHSGDVQIQFNYLYVEPGKGLVVVEGRTQDNDKLLYSSKLQGELETIVSVLPNAIDGYSIEREEEFVEIKVREETTRYTFVYKKDPVTEGEATVVFKDEAGVEFKRDTITLSDISATQHYIVPKDMYLNQRIYRVKQAENPQNHIILNDGMVTELYYQDMGEVQGSGNSGGNVQPSKYKITASAGKGGYISPSGTQLVVEGRDKTFDIIVEENYRIDEVRVDGQRIDLVDTYTFKKVKNNHSIHVIFKEIDKLEEPEEPKIKDSVALDKNNEEVYMKGLPGNRFEPTKRMTRAEATVMFSRLLVERMDENVTYDVEFSDVQGDEWYANAVGYMVSLGVISGYPDGTFGGDKPITRGEFAVLASRFEELEEGDYNQFVDVSDGYWAKDYVNSVANKGWMIGYPDGRFKPEHYITRAEVVTLTNRMLERNYEKTSNPFVDVEETYWAYEEICEASNQISADYLGDE